MPPRSLMVHLLAAISLLAGCQSPGKDTSSPPSTSAQEVGEHRAGSGVLKGYLPREQLPNSLALLPPPPAPGSAREAADLEAYRAARALRDSPRWAWAARDANLQFPQAAEVFSCTLDIPITEQQTPHLVMLLRRTLTDAGLATYKAKDHYHRTRPFALMNESSCHPADDARLSKDGAYPSGHAALGWAWGLVLSGLAPERTNALLQRGDAFAQSRMVCGAHWQSDVDAGRVVGAAAVARLQADPVFRAQAERARAEIAAVRAQGLRSPRTDCAQEARALAR